MTTAPRTRASPRMSRLTSGLWLLFLLWSALVALVWCAGWGEAEVVAWSQRVFHLRPWETGTAPPTLQAFLLRMLGWLDPAWLVLAAVQTYLFTTWQEGLGTARRWSAAIFLGAFLIALLSARTGWPLGPIFFTTLLGSRVGPVPLCVPLLWLTAGLGARDLALRLRPGLAPAPLALGTGALLGLFDLALEPVAWKVRVFWLWYPGQLPSPAWPPWHNLLTWMVAGALLSATLREHEVARSPQPFFRSPAAVYLLFLGLCVIALLGHHGRS